MDATGRLPVRSRKGNEYCLILYSFDSNYIRVEATQSKSGSDLLGAFDEGYDFFRKRGDTPRLMFLDNALPDKLRQRLGELNVDFQIVPPHAHRRNAAERAIRTFKNHFISVLCTTDPSFPLNLWDELLEQTECTLNLLHGPFDFNKTPLAPAGTAVLIHEKPADRRSWAPHGVKGFYIGPALKHYRCYKTWASDTEATRITDTLAWHPVTFTLPVADKTDTLAMTIEHLCKQLRGLDKQPALEPSFRALHAHLVDLLPTQPVVAASADDNYPAAEQRVSEQRVEPTEGTTAAPLVNQNSTPPIGGDNVTYASIFHRGRKHKVPLSAAVTHGVGPTPNLASASTPVLPLHPSTHIGQHQVCEINGHRGPAKQRSKLYFRVRWANFTGDTWKSWRDVMRLVCLEEYLNKHNELQYLIPHLAATPDTIALPPTDHYAAATTDDTTGMPLRYNSLLRGEEAPEWEEASVEEFVRLIDETQTMRFIHAHEKPKDRKPSYYNPQCSLKLKDGKVIKRVRGTIGGDRVDYPGPTSSNTASILTLKMLLNAVVSDPGAIFTTADIKDYFLNTTLPRPEYMWIQLAQIPERARTLFKVSEFAQASLLAQLRLNEHLARHGYHQAANTPCLYRHQTRPITFTLVVDDFGIKSPQAEPEHLEHLLSTLRELYTITVGDGSRYLGLHLDWDYAARTVVLTMPDYVRKALQRFGIDVSTFTQFRDAPADYVPIVYGRTTAATDLAADSPPLDPARTKRIQQIIGVFLYYARMVDPNMITRIGQLASQQARPTEALDLEVTKFLHFAATWPNAGIRYHASDMVIHCQSDASYLSEHDAGSRVGGFMWMGQHCNDYSSTAPPSPINGPISVRSTRLDVVVASAFEAEYGGLFLNGQDAEEARTIAEDMGYPQGQTFIQTDNEVAEGIANDTCKRKRSKAIDKRFHWIRDRIRQGRLGVFWRAGKNNLADYFTKLHPVKHHRSMRSFFVTDPPRAYLRPNARTRRRERRRTNDIGRS